MVFMVRAGVIEPIFPNEAIRKVKVCFSPSILVETPMQYLHMIFCISTGNDARLTTFSLQAATFVCSSAHLPKASLQSEILNRQLQIRMKIHVHH